ncbi:hypothetical protein Zm00014a_027050 [Zea mays]|uniref:DUF4057 domain-containing protein n=1 Tax=Zea mays TaxID=4577 RepID=A0A3L6E1K5_MAIZE|nr:hypothetical protein Zm00014a_027050 [Zea mays]
MERPAPVRKSHTSTADLLVWPEGAPQELPAGSTPPSNRRPHQPSEALRKVVFGGQVTEAEAESLNKSPSWNCHLTNYVGVLQTDRSHQNAPRKFHWLFRFQSTTRVEGDDKLFFSPFRKPCSAPKWKEMTGSGIFAAGGEGEEDESANVSATSVRTAPKNYQHTHCSIKFLFHNQLDVWLQERKHFLDAGLRSWNTTVTRTNPAAFSQVQAISTISHISFAEEESISPKKPTSISEVAKQRELSGTLLSEDDSKMKRQISDLKSKELSGHDIFAPPEDPRPRNSENGSTSQTPGKNAHVSNFKFGEADEDSAVKTAKKIPTKKFTDLAGNIFKGDDEAPGTAEKHHLSTAKLKEMTGSDIFADGEAPSRDYLGGIRKPPGGESSIALV